MPFRVKKAQVTSVVLSRVNSTAETRSGSTVLGHYGDLRRDGAHGGSRVNRPCSGGQVSCTPRGRRGGAPGVAG